ncbi:hypothetical protein GE09DRAFT_1136592, partial [Coniochaeta sp. 2T2.1]
MALQRGVSGSSYRSFDGLQVMALLVWLFFRLCTLFPVNFPVTNFTRHILILLGFVQYSFPTIFPWHIASFCIHVRPANTTCQWFYMSTVFLSFMPLPKTRCSKDSLPHIAQCLHARRDLSSPSLRPAMVHVASTSLYTYVEG